MTKFENNESDSMGEPDLTRDPDSTTEELTAYLDGELDLESMQRVELRLGNDPDYRAELQALQKTWDLLDQLPLAEPGTSFTKTTMELIVGDAVKTAKKKQTRRWVWPLRLAILLAIPALLFAVVFAVVRDFQTKPDRILIENLSVIENQPRYDAITHDLDFLVRLFERELFADSKLVMDEKGELVGIDAKEEGVLIPPSPEARQTYVEGLDVQQRVKLKRKLDDFLKLTPAALAKSKQFDVQLNAMKNSTQLTATLKAYYDWLLEIDSGEKSRLRDMSGDERVDAIAAIRHRQALKELGRDAIANLASPDDASPILAWSEIVFNLYEQEIRNRFSTTVVGYSKSQGRPAPPLEFVKRKARSGDLPTLVDFLMRVDRDFVEDLILGDRETKMLYDLLSINAQIQMDERNLKERNELVMGWVESAIQSKRAISIEMLKQFERRLPNADRDKLAKMSTEDYLSTLKRKFLQRRKSPTSQNRFEQELEELMDFAQ